MPQAITCPDAAELRRIALGEYSPSAADDALAHVENCADCVQRLGTLLAEDTLVDAIRSKGTSVDNANHLAVSRLVARVQSLLPSTKNTDRTADLTPPGLESRSDTPVFSWIQGPTEEADSDNLAPPQSPDEIGRIGPYRILSVLGEGGMGKVYRAEDPNLQRSVALKVMKPSLAKNALAKQRFIREARLAAMIEHDHIVHIYQVGEDRGIPFLAMQLLKGASLEDMLKRSGALKIKQVLRIGMQIADGLSAAHERGMIHRDIKPANVWIEPTGGGRVKILDFGLARIGESDISITQSGAILGTPAYMAPEQARGETVDHRCDLYSLGCVLYRMTTGDLPIQGNDTMAMLMALALKEPPAPIQVNPQMPQALSDLIMKLLAKDPDQRVSSAKEVSQTLRSLNQGESKQDAAAPTEALGLSELQLPALTPTTPTPTRKKPIPTSIMLAIAGIASVLLLLGGAVVYQFAFRTPHGTLLVEVDGDADVRFSKGKLQIFDDKGNLKYELEPSDLNKTLPAGIYRIKVTGPDGLKLDTDKFEMTQAGAKIRVILDKGSLAKGGGGEPKAEPRPSNAVDKDKPFVILRDAKVAGEFQGFTAAIAALADGDILEIHGNGPFTVAGVYHDKKSLHLRAGAGYRPKLIPSNDMRKHGAHMFIINQAPLSVEGCDLECLEPHTNVGIFAGGGGKWRFDHCRLAMADSNVGFLIHYNGPFLSVSNSMLIQHASHTCIVVRGKAEVDLTNNIVYSSAYGTLQMFPLPDGQKVTLRNNSFYSNVTVSIQETEQKSAPVLVRAEDNVFATLELVRVAGEGKFAKAQFDKLHWQGKNNTYAIAKDQNFVRYSPGKAFIKDWEAWQAHVGKAEHGSNWMESSAFPWLAPMNQAGLTNTRSPMPARLAKAGVGPDLAMIGPGEAYMAARKKRGEPTVARSKPHADGPFVLLRQDKEITGYQTLVRAWQEAKNGDVIEIRTDDPVQGALSAIGMVRTVRAGSGYRPIVIGELRLHPDDQVSIEGITFRDCTVRNLEVKAGRSRFTNCSFEGKIGAVLNLFASKDKPVEIENCAVHAHAEFHMSPGAKVHLDHSYLQDLLFTAKDGNACQVDIDQCLFLDDKRGLYFSNTGTFAFSVKRSWIESPGFLRPTRKNQLEWRGEKNVFATGGSTAHYYPGIADTILGLPAWQKHFNTDADSTSVEPMFYDAKQWRLPGSQTCGADVDRILAPMGGTESPAKMQR